MKFAKLKTRKKFSAIQFVFNNHSITSQCTIGHFPYIISRHWETLCLAASLHCHVSSMFLPPNISSISHTPDHLVELDSQEAKLTQDCSQLKTLYSHFNIRVCLQLSDNYQCVHVILTTMYVFNICSDNPEEVKIKDAVSFEIHNTINSGTCTFISELHSFAVPITWGTYIHGVPSHEAKYTAVQMQP